MSNATPLTETQWQQLARNECGQPDPGDKNLVAAYTALDNDFPLFWAIYADKRYLGGLRLQYLWTKRHALEYLIGQIWQYVTYGDSDTNESLSDFAKNLGTLLDGVDALIAAAETRSQGVRGPAVAPIAATAPITPDYPCQPDPNGRALRGDPLRPRFYRPR